MRRSIVPIFIPHLGCPHQCVFCDQRAIAASRAPTPQEVAAEIEQGLKWAVRPQAAFYGGSFTALEPGLQERYLQAVQPFLRSGQVCSLRVSTRPDAIDQAALNRLVHYGVATIELGAQSMDELVLRLSGRGHTAQDTARAAELVRQAGFELVLQMMAGLPGDCREKTRATAQALAALRPAQARIYPVCVIHGTPLCAMMERGEYQPLSLEEAVEWSADALETLEGAGVTVIRIGLNPTEELSGGSVAAGAYHPALGELVRGRVLLRQTVRQIELKGRSRGTAILSVPKGCAPLLRGQKRCNMDWLAQQYPGIVFEIKEREGQQEPVLLLWEKAESVSEIG